MCAESEDINHLLPDCRLLGSMYLCFNFHVVIEVLVTRYAMNLMPCSGTQIIQCGCVLSPPPFANIDHFLKIL